MSATAPDGSPVGLYATLAPLGEQQLIHEAVPAGSEILELGCGAGRITHELVALGHPVVAVDNSRAAATGVQAGVRIAKDLTAPVVFVYVRRGPSSALGEPYYQRRLDAEMASGHRALTDALAVAEEAGVPATGGQLAGNPARRVVEFARLRGARLVVLGSRQRRLRRGVARGVIRSADRPVLVAGGTAPPA